jgi:carbamoyltransferase
MNILGISAYYHDSAACLVQDGKVVSAIQEERFSRKKHDHRFPTLAIKACLDQSDITADKLDYVAFYDKPFIKFERLLETYVAYAPVGIQSFLKAMPLWIKQKLWIKDLIKKQVGYEGPIIFPEHHESHAASAFFPSPFRSAAFLTLDGVGEWTTTSFGTAKDNYLQIDSEIHFPHSIGLLYSAFTYYTGFKVNSGEYKVMGLAPYGEPKYVDLIMEHLIDLKEDGSYKLNMAYFNYCAGLTMTNRRFHKLFGGPPRKPESALTKRDMDMARSIQVVTEEIVLRSVRHVHNMTGERYLCLGGGVALNCVANGRILREAPFDKIWIQPAAGDAGGALGAALFVWYQYLNNERKADDISDFQKGSYWGPSYDDVYIRTFLDNRQLTYKKLPDDTLAETVADLVVQEKVIGWFSGPMEFGPRALGSRSIIGDARSPKMQSIMNLKIKFRESFRPFAPSVLGDQVDEWFELTPEGKDKTASPYMLLVAPVKKEKRVEALDDEGDLEGIEKLKVQRSQVPAITHVDHSARIQTVHAETNPRYYAMIKRFYEKTGCPIVVNTSFNVRGEPIVCTPEDAYQCFMRTEMDYLVMENYLLDKKEQPPWQEEGDWREEYELD